MSHDKRETPASSSMYTLRQARTAQGVRRTRRKDLRRVRFDPDFARAIAPAVAEFQKKGITRLWWVE